MDLVRAILLKVEESEPFTVNEKSFSDAGYDPFDVARHVELMEEARLLEAGIARASGAGAIAARIERLTWPGHDFLDSVRSDTVWQKTKATILEKVGSASFDVIKAVATAVALKSLGL
jgi:hypothetical protein